MTLPPNWAVVVGVDDYGGAVPTLSAAVSDAVAFCEWVRSEQGGNVPAEHLRLLLGRSPGDEARVDGERPPTKDNIVTAINEVVTESGGGGERLFVYFAGHGITARVSNRDEGALVTQGFDELHPDHSLALRSLTEFLETTQFRDQFFFVDACRNVPWEGEFEIGRWPIPRRRDPGLPPVQQFVLHATSPGLTAAELGHWPGEAVGAFTEVLMAALEGTGRAKAWSWERGCYEVRWESLAGYVKDAMEARRHATSPRGDPPAGGWPIQVPQDAGARGVAGRERDALLVSFPRARVRPVQLTVKLLAQPPHEEAEISVLDAVGEPVASALNVTGTSQPFTLPPKTYAVRATATDDRTGRLKAPVDLYEDDEVEIALVEPVGAGPGEVDEPLGPETDATDDRPGEIVVVPADPVTVVELCDEAGEAVAAQPADPATGAVTFSVPAGFYRVRLVGPEPGGVEHFVVLSPGEEERPGDARPPEPAARAVELAEAAGGRYDPDARAVELGGETLAWAAPSTILAVALGEALGGDPAALERLGARSPLAALGEDEEGVALLVVDAGGARPELVARAWPTGEEVDDRASRLEWSEAGVAAFASGVHDAGPHWLSLEDGGVATVVALPVLPGRLAAVIAELHPDGMRLYQAHPTAGSDPSATPARLRRVEHLERLLLAGRLDGARALAEELADAAREDPFAGCLAGYVLLRLGLHERLGETADAIAAVAPGLADAYVLRGEHQAFLEQADGAAQAFADAVNTGIPAFGEGLTRVVEGLRTTGLVHPRGALVRHLFQRHARGSMWAAFTPRRPLKPGRLVVSGADVGFEG